MLSRCPHCQKQLNLSAAQQEKIDKAFAALTPGQTLRLGCPLCKKPIELKRQPSAEAPADAGVMKNVLYSAHGGTEDRDVSRIVEQAARQPPKPARLPPEAPKPPDTSWLEGGEFDQGRIVEDVPRVMILVTDEAARASVQNVFEGLGYQAISAGSAAQAIDTMQFMNIDAIVLHSRYEGADLAASTFHKHMESMSMSRRRFIYYVLLGPEFYTLYDLQALANSANLVVNDNELDCLEIVIKKGLNDYDALFGPYVEVLKQYGVK